MNWISISATDALGAVLAVAALGFARVWWTKLKEGLVAATEKAMLERTGDIVQRLNQHDEDIDKLKTEAVRQQERHTSVKEQLGRIESGVQGINKRIDDVVGNN